MAQKRSVQYSDTEQQAQVAEYGATPPRPTHFKYRSYRSAETDYNQLEWGAVSTSLVDHFVIESSTGYEDGGTWEILAGSITNAGTANTYSITSEISDKWFRIKAVNTASNESPYAGPIENRRPGRTVTVKGYFLDLNGDPVTDGTITVALSSDTKFFTLDGHQHVENAVETVQPEADTGFWFIRLFSSNEFSVAGIGYTFTFRGSREVETTVAKVVPDGSSDEVWFDELANAA